MNIEINKKKYTCKIGTRAVQNFVAKIGKDGLEQGKIDFDCIVDLYWDGIRDKGNLTRMQLEDWVDDNHNAAVDVMEEVAAYNKLHEEAKK